MSTNNHTSNDKREQLIIPDHLARREMALSEIAQLASAKGLYHYLSESPYVRHTTLNLSLNGSGTVNVKSLLTVHSVHDIINLLSESDDIPNNLWQNAKDYLGRDNPELMENMLFVKLPSWKDSKRYRTEVVTDGWLFNLLYALRTPLAVQFRTAFATGLDKYPKQYHDTIISELTKDVGWAGTRNRLEMQSIYEPGDYDNPAQPPGSPD
jgi:hypothetical protein